MHNAWTDRLLDLGMNADAECWQRSYYEGLFVSQYRGTGEVFGYGRGGDGYGLDDGNGFAAGYVRGSVSSTAFCPVPLGSHCLRTILEPQKR